MPNLILMRHGKSSWSDPMLEDFERPLKKRGRASAAVVGQWLRAQGYMPDEVLCSSAERTGETFLRMQLDVQATFTRALYHAETQTILDLMRKATGETLLVIGHNPGLADCASQIVDEPPEHLRFMDFPTGATLVASFEGTWAALDWGDAHVLDFVIPRELMAD